MRDNYLIRWISFRPASGLEGAQDLDHVSGMSASYGSVAEWLHLQDVKVFVEREYESKHQGEQWKVTEYESILNKDQALAFKTRFDVLPWRERLPQ